MLSDTQKDVLTKLTKSSGWMTGRELGAAGREQFYYEEAEELEIKGYIQMKPKKDISARYPTFDARITDEGKQALAQTQNKS